MNASGQVTADLKVVQLLIAFVSIFSSSLCAGDSADSIQTSPSLIFSGREYEKNLGNYGNWVINGALSGFGLLQNNPDSTENRRTADISNAMLIIQQTKGPLRAYAQIGYYDILTIGQPDQRFNKQTIYSYGLAPQAYISYLPTDNLSISIGKLAAIGGYESTFSYQNLNIERGVLWTQTSSVSNGVQVDLTNGPIKASISWTDGFYSNHFNWLGTSFSYQIDHSQKIGFIWTGSLSPNSYTNQNTPLLQNNSQIFNLLYALELDRWSFTPYLQYTSIPANSSIGISSSVETYGAALLSNYKFELNQAKSEGKAQKISLPFRIEYLQTTGQPGSNAPNLLYGPGSSALTLTATPTIQYEKYFARVEISYINIYNLIGINGFGANGLNKSQYRGLLEVGLLY